ncbi:hypothetical protein FRC18_008312, partial [Serendipita sp. 400]
DLGLGKLFGGLLNRLRRQNSGPDLDTDKSEIRENGNMELHRRDPELGEDPANHQNRSHDEIEHYR